MQNSFLFSLCFAQSPVKNIRRSNKLLPTSGLLFGTCVPKAFLFFFRCSAFLFPLFFSDENNLFLPGNVGHKIQTICLKKKGEESLPRGVGDGVIIPSGFRETVYDTITPPPPVFFKPVIQDVVAFPKTGRCDTWPSVRSARLSFELFSRVYSSSDISEV